MRSAPRSPRSSARRSSRVPFHQVTVSGFAGISLRAGEIEVVVIPALGLKIGNLRRARGREWLWHNPQIGYTPPTPGASYVDTADSGGWDECFPTVGTSSVPGAPGAPMLPDHGEIWSSRWESAVYESGGAPTLTGTVRGTRFPYEFTRELSLDAAEPVVRFTYRLRHLGGAAFPWIWSAHPLLTVQPGTTLELPGVSQVRVDAAHHRPDLEVDDVVSWPGGIGGRGDVFEFPERGESGWAVKVFADAGGDGRAVVTDPKRGERLEFRAPPADVPQVGMWINCGGWAPNGREPYYNLALEPCIGAPDRLDRAAAWGLVQTLREGEERRWTVEVRLLEDGD